MPFTTLEDVTLFYTDEGSGEPALLFVHGYTCDSHDWSWQLAHFAGRHRVIAVDIRGHGRSSVPDRGYGHLDFASDLAGLLEELRTGPVVAIGHSLGGVITSALAVEHPELVQAVVGIDPGYHLPAELSAMLPPVVEALAAPDPVPVAQALLGSTCYTSASPAALRTWHMRRIARTPPHVLRESLTSLFSGMARQEASGPYLPRRKCPVLSFYTDPERAAAEAALFTDSRSRVVTFEGSGHWLHQERAAEVNHVIDTWLAGLAD